MTAPQPPEVRQCQDTDSHLFGAVAVPGGGLSAGQWGVMHPEIGGHWAQPEEVENWAVIFLPPIPPETAVKQARTARKAKEDK